MFSVFERPLIAGQIYPCTVEDISAQLSQLPAEDLDGLHAAGLVPSTRKDSNANGRYYSKPTPCIHLCSYSDTFTFRLASHWKKHEVERWLAVEIAFGMEVERQGSRWLCRWEPGRLRAYTLQHVLLHEIGHHVYWMHRFRDGLTIDPGTRVKEQFAEDYALQHHRPR